MPRKLIFRLLKQSCSLQDRQVCSVLPVVGVGSRAYNMQLVAWWGKKAYNKKHTFVGLTSPLGTKDCSLQRQESESIYEAWLQGIISSK